MNLLKEMLLQQFFALIPFVMFNIYYRDKTQNYSRKFIMLTSASCLFLSMTFGTNVIQGFFYDVRYIIIFFGLVFGGLQTGFLLLAEFVVYRLFIGGEGKWFAMLTMMIMFPLSVLLYKIYQKTSRKPRIVILAGCVCSLLPSAMILAAKPDVFLRFAFLHIVVIPVENFIGIWVLITLFKKSVLNKELFISYAQNERVRVISQVAASLVHEVRNPLTAVKGFLQLIRESNLAREKVERYLEICGEEIQRTENILSEYLSASKPITEKREATDLFLQLQNIADVLQPYANMNNVLLELDHLDKSIKIMANPDKIKQIFMNLIKNAIEACIGIPHGKVDIHIHLVDDKALLTIKDNGVGMSKEEVSQLGSIYFSTKASGTGLGLTFSYQAIRELGGMISVLSEPKVGTQFTLTFPILDVDTEIKGNSNDSTS